jgi:hypothetical protein
MVGLLSNIFGKAGRLLLTRRSGLPGAGKYSTSFVTLLSFLYPVRSSKTYPPLGVPVSLFGRCVASACIRDLSTAGVVVAVVNPALVSLQRSVRYRDLASIRRQAHGSDPFQDR